MSEPSALYCRVRLSRPAFDAFLAAPLSATSAHNDWEEWLSDAEMYDRDEFFKSLRSMRPQAGATNSSLLEEWLGREGAFARSEYDEAAQTWRFGVVEFAEDYESLVSEFAALRAVAAYKDLPGSDAAIVLPYLFGPDGLSAAMVIERGSSALVKATPHELAVEAQHFLKGSLALARAASSNFRAVHPTQNDRFAPHSFHGRLASVSGRRPRCRTSGHARNLPGRRTGLLRGAAHPQTFPLLEDSVQHLQGNRLFEQ